MLRSLSEIQTDLDNCRDKAEHFDLLQEYKTVADNALKEINDCSNMFYIENGVYGLDNKPVFRIHPSIPSHLFGPLQIINNLSFNGRKQ